MPAFAKQKNSSNAKGFLWRTTIRVTMAITWSYDVLPMKNNTLPFLEENKMSWLENEGLRFKTILVNVWPVNKKLQTIRKYKFIMLDLPYTYTISYS